MLETAAAADPELDPEDLVHFSVGDLPSRGYGVMGEIRRQGKLCDVTLKVRPGEGEGSERGWGTSNPEGEGGIPQSLMGVRDPRLLKGLRDITRLLLGH